MTTPALLTIVAQPPGTRRTRPVPAALHDVTVHHPHRSLLLERLSLDVRRGEVTSVLSRHDVTAGTILDLLAGRAQPSGGSVRVLGREVTRLAPDALRRLRREHIGRVFPTYGAQPRLTVAQNLHVARRRSGLAADHAWVDRVAAALDLHGMLGFRAGEGIDDRRLRWTVARSLATRPALVLVDDVTTRLPRREQEVLLVALRDAARALDVAVLVATCDPITASGTDRVVRLARGRIADDTAA
jgi:putative ABC transport system ATP-binding protein